MTPTDVCFLKLEADDILHELANNPADGLTPKQVKSLQWAVAMVTAARVAARTLRPLEWYDPLPADAVPRALRTLERELLRGKEVVIPKKRRVTKGKKAKKGSE